MQQSNSIEITYQNIYRGLSSQEAVDPDLLKKSLEWRLPKLKKCFDPFSKPCPVSKAALSKDSFTFTDGVSVKIEPYQLDLSIKLSEKLALDEVEAFTFLRSFLYLQQYNYTPSSNGEGFSKSADSESALLDAASDFYFEERIFILRVFIPLYRAYYEHDDPHHDLASDILKEVAPDTPKFIASIIAEYVRRTKQEVPPTIPHTGASLANRAKLAKQIVREQICMIEVVFWATYHFRSPGSFVAEVYEAVYSSSLGTQQKNQNLLIDKESSQLIADLQSVIILTAVQLLSVDLLYEQGIDLEVVSLPRHGYFAQPEELVKIHRLVYSTPTQPRYSPIVLAWTCVIRRLALAEAENANYPEEYVPLMELLVPDRNARDSVWQEFTRVILNPAMDLFGTIRALLASPLLNSEAAAELGSSISNPNDTIVRAIIKGLVIGLTELVRVEYIEDFDNLVEVWITLFGSGEWSSIAPLCSEFWQVDAKIPSSNRRALLEIARDRFPVQARPLIRILRSLTAAGDFHKLGISISHSHSIEFSRAGCAFSVFEYFDTLPTLTQVIPTDKDRMASLMDVRNTSNGIMYMSLKPMRLPGGAVIPPKTIGNLISDAEPGSPLVVVWQFPHSGWRLALGLLKDYIKMKQNLTGAPSMRFGVGGRTLGSGPGKTVDLSVEDLGIEEGVDDGTVITDLLELFRSILQNNPAIAPLLITRMTKEEEGDETFTAWDRASLVEVIPVILQDALLFNTPRAEVTLTTRLITNAIGVLTALLPYNPEALWSSLRSSTLFTGNSKQKGNRASTPKLLAFERAAGSYPMTLSLLDLVRALMDDCVHKMFNVTPSFRTMKSEVLLRSLALVHNEIWIDYESWKYLHLADKYQIGYKITSLFSEILTQGPDVSLEVDTPPSADNPLSSLITITRFVIDAFFSKATSSTIAPLVSTIPECHQLRSILYKTRRFNDAQNLDLHLESCLRLSRKVLVRKAFTTATRACLLEQGLFMGIGGRAASASNASSQRSPLDIIACSFTRLPYEYSMQTEATMLLTTLCVSVSSCHPSPPSIVGHLENPIDLAQHFIWTARRMEDTTGCMGAWAFLSTVMDTQPALAALLVSGKSISSIIPTSAHAVPRDEDNIMEPITIIDAINEALKRWQTLWKDHPNLLASVLKLLDSIWQHAREHPAAIEALRKNERLWVDVVQLLKEPISQPPGGDTGDITFEEGKPYSSLHQSVAGHSYQALAKAHALHVIALDVALSEGGLGRTKSPSLPMVIKLVECPKDMVPLLTEGLENPSSPELHMKARKHLETSFPGVSLDSLRGVRLLSDRTFGDDYLFPASLVEACLSQYVDEGSAVSQAEASLAFKEVLSLNLDWSLTDSHVALTRSWSQLIDALAPALADSRDAQQGLIAGLKLGKFVAAETRGGPIMTAVHGDRIRCLHSIVNTSWPYDITFDQLLDFIAPLKIIITHEIHNPLSSVTGLAIPPFHRPLLEIIYFCAQKALSLDPMKLSAAKKSVLSSSFTSAVLFAIDGLRVAFEKATELQSEDLDADIQLLVSVFSVCIRHELGVGLSIWLARLQSTNLIRASLDLFSRSDAAGVQYPAILRIRPSPLYSLAVLQLHQALARLPSSAERLAHEGIMGSYAMNGLTPALETALVDVTHVGHHAWCAIVAVVARITEVLGPTGSHFVDAEVVGFVQLYGVQLSRTLTWRLGDNLTLSLLREMEAVISLFHAIAISTSVATSNSSGEILRAYGEKALFLVQQLNAAVSYPNQLAGQLLAMSPIEGAVFQQEADLGTIQSSIDYLDKGDRPLLASVIQTLLRLTSTLLTTLVLANGGDMLLMRTDNARPPDLPLMSPSSKVSSEEPATMGTLHELGNWSIQLVVHLLKQKTPVPPPGPSSSELSVSLLDIVPFDGRKTLQAARQTIESLMVYVATQLSRWVERERQDASLELGKLTLGRGDGKDLDGFGMRGVGHSRRSSVGRGGASGGRTSLPLMRGSTLSVVQDQARELSILASRAKDVLGKLADDDGESSVLLLDILIGFTSAKLLRN